MQHPYPISYGCGGRHIAYGANSSDNIDLDRQSVVPGEISPATTEVCTCMYVGSDILQSAKGSCSI